MENNNRSDHFRIKVSLIVVAIDDFMGKPIIKKGELHVYAKDENKPMIKQDGYYVFTNLKSRLIELHIESQLYNHHKMLIDLDKLDQVYPIVKVRMLPNRLFPIARETTCIEGIAEPNSNLYITCCSIEKPYKLLYEYKKEKEDSSNRIYIYASDHMDMDGRMFLIKGKETEEYFTILHLIDDKTKEYGLEKSLNYHYKKIGTSIYPVSIITADENGMFFLPLHQRLQKKLIYQCEAVGNHRVKKDCEISYGKINYIDLTSHLNDRM